MGARIGATSSGSDVAAQPLGEDCDREQDKDQGETADAFAN